MRVPARLAAAFVAAPLLFRASVARAQEAAPVPDPLHDWLEWITRAIEVAGIAVIVLGGIAATLHFAWAALRSRGRPGKAYHAYRANLGRAILLGLELLVAADIIGTVAVDPTPRSLAVLAGIVLIRTFLSFSLEVEIEGRWPWQRGRAREEGGGGSARAETDGPRPDARHA